MAGTSKVEHILANVSHYSLYAFMTIMPASGIAMGYYGGNTKYVYINKLPVFHLVSSLVQTMRYDVTHNSNLMNSLYSGKGLPFFGLTVPGVVKTDENKKSTGAIVGQVRFVMCRRQNAFVELN